jgi:hypothetical protein
VKLVAKKAVSIFILFVFCFANSTCKKITKYPINLLGYWIGSPIANATNCEQVFIDITADRDASYGGDLGTKGCETKFNGKVRFNKTHLFIGITKFKFIEKPIKIENGDSITFASIKKGIVHSKITGQMTLLNSVFHGKTTYKFIKVLEY